MARLWPDVRLRVAGVAGVAGGLSWAVLAVLTFAVDRGVSLLGYGSLDAFTPVALALTLAGIAGYRTRTRDSWSRLTTVGFAVFVAGLLGTLAGAVAYLAGGLLAGWTVSVWSYVLALVGSTVFGVGLLWTGTPPRSGAALLAGALPVGIGVSLALTVGGVVSDEAVFPVGPGVLLGVGTAALGWWTVNAERRME